MERGEREKEIDRNRLRVSETEHGWKKKMAWV